MKPYLYKKTKQIPIYRGNLHVILCNSIEILRKKIAPDFKGNEIYAHAIALSNDKINGYCIVLNLQNPFAIITNGIISHEAYHIANFIAHDRGIMLDYDNDEPLAYLIQWITDEVHEFIKQKKYKKHLKQ